MYQNKKILAIIPARAGSKGIPNKNIIDIKGKPLIAYTILAAKRSKYIDKILVSTDSKKIADISIEYGAEVPFLRPKSLASDNAKTIHAVLYTLRKISVTQTYDAVVILQPTSPLRDERDIDNSLELFYKKSQDVVSINKIDINPYLVRKLKNNKLNNLINSNSTIRRQDLPLFYKVNGAIYINKIARLNAQTSLNDNPIGYLMDDSNSLDIDTFNDLKKFAAIIKNK